MNDLAEKIEIRQATFDDLVLISVLASTTFYEAYFEQDGSANLARYIHESFALDALTTEFQDRKTTFLLVFVNGKAVGYARLIEDSAIDGIISPGSIELKRIYVLERYWGTGAGKALLEQCIGLASDRGSESIWLGVWEENRRAQAFYAKYDFRKVGTVTFPYGDVVGTNLVLELKLP